MFIENYLLQMNRYYICTKKIGFLILFPTYKKYIYDRPILLNFLIISFPSNFT